MEESFFDNWTTQLRKGLLEFGILGALGGERLYGYQIVQRLKQIDGLVIREGTVYPILSRFKREGLVRTRLEESAEGPARKYYELTARGRDMLARMETHWELTKRGIDDMQSEGGP